MKKHLNYPHAKCDKKINFKGTLEKHIGAAHESVQLFFHYF